MKLTWKGLKELGPVSVFFIMLGITVTAIVAFPALFGVLAIIMGDNLYPSPIESIGLALLSAALAGVIFLLIKPGVASTNVNSSEDVVRQGRPASEITGGFFIAAALAFALFAVLCPFLGVVSEGQRFFQHTAIGDFYEAVVTWVSLLSLMIGTSAFVVSLILGPFLFASDRLRKKKRM